MARVLVVDDAEDLRLMLRLVLERSGHEVTEAAGGHEALVLIADTPPTDLIVLDVQMPFVDGWGVLEAVRAHPHFHDVPIVMCSVKSSQGDRDRARSLGCDDYLAKPFDLAELTSAVDNLLSR